MKTRTSWMAARILALVVACGLAPARAAERRAVPRAAPARAALVNERGLIMKAAVLWSALAFALIAAPVAAHETSRSIPVLTLPGDPCKNHYILDEPCQRKWTAINAGLNDLDVRVIAVDPLNRMTLYAGGTSGVFKSTDAGRSWKMTGLRMGPLMIADTAAAFAAFPNLPRPFVARSVVTNLAVDSAHPTDVYASTIASGGAWCGQRRLFKSVDGGETWTDGVSPEINGVDNIHSLALAATEPATLYLANWDESGDTWSPLVRSTDGAATWTYLGLPVLHVLVVDPRDASTIYAGTLDFPPFLTSFRNGVLKSTDGGATWIATGLTGSGISALTVDPGNRGTIYAATSTDTSTYAASRHDPQRRTYVLKSLDGGANWAMLADLSPYRVTAIAVDPRNTDKIYVATDGGGVLRSIDTGATWAAFNDGLGTLSIHSLAVVADDPMILYAGTQSGVFKITD